MEFFATIGNGWLVLQKSSILNIWLVSEYTSVKKYNGSLPDVFIIFSKASQKKPLKVLDQAFLPVEEIYEKLKMNGFTNAFVLIYIVQLDSRQDDVCWLPFSVTVSQGCFELVFKTGWKLSVSMTTKLLQIARMTRAKIIKSKRN